MERTAQKKDTFADHPFVFVVETCQNCKEHHWNTRHDEAKYLDFFNRGTFQFIEGLDGIKYLKRELFLPFK